MEITGKKVLVLGGWGLVGSAICRELMNHSPAQLIVSSLRENEAKSAVEQLSKEFPNSSTEFIPHWGNIFVRHQWKDDDWGEVLSSPENRKVAIQDIYDELNDEILLNSELYHLISTTKPDVVIDCINTATAIAYKDIYRNVNVVRGQISNGQTNIEDIERLMASIYIPQLIRHIQLLYRALVDFKVKMYLKIGTSGTGGMGLNIPYTHSEERPSRVLLAKSAVAGAQTLLLYLMARTPDAPMVKEIKPTAAIAWKRIAYGDVIRRGKPIELIDMPVENAKKLEGTFSRDDIDGIYSQGDSFKSVFIDTGENGIFSRAEFEAISSLGQMEIVTPEEIATYTVHEILGGNTGKDVIQGLDAFTLGPTYRGGFLQSLATKKLKELESKHNTESVAFELLGPPRLSKLLYEANILKKIAKSFNEVLNTPPETLSDRAYNLISNNSKFRAEMLSIGLVILLPDGRSYLRGKDVKIPVLTVESQIEITPENVEKWCNEGWIDLRPSNFRTWQARLSKIINQVKTLNPEDTSSANHLTMDYWDNFETIDEGKIIAWIFQYEDKGWRFKR